MSIKADRLRFEEVLTNIFENSTKYCQENCRITIDAEPANNDVIISITDNGIGMTKEQIERIFDEFYKADYSRHDIQSTGLGMSISKRIVEKHRGHICVKSPGPATSLIKKKKEIFVNMLAVDLISEMYTGIAQGVFALIPKTAKECISLLLA